MTASMLAGCTSAENDGAAASKLCTEKIDPKDLKIVLSIGTFASDYFQEFITGAKEMAKSLDLDSNLTVYAHDYDGQKALNTISPILTKDGKRTILVADSPSPAFTKPIVDLAAKNGTRTVTIWSRPSEIHPWDTGQGCWVAHQTFDGVQSGSENAKALFDSMGGQGSVVAVAGAPGSVAKERETGLSEALAEYPGIELRDSQIGGWQQTKAQSVTQSLLGQYGDQIKGIWSANDSMALGVIEALRAKGLAGRVQTTGSDGSVAALDLVKSGEMVSTMLNRGYEQGALAVALAFAAATGDLTVADMSHADRDFYMKQTLVTKDNVDQIINDRVDLAALTYQKMSEDVARYNAGQIKDLK
jgi:ribose transport system substrate-binding protein